MSTSAHFSVIPSDNAHTPSSGWHQQWQPRSLLGRPNGPVCDNGEVHVAPAENPTHEMISTRNLDESHRSDLVPFFNMLLILPFCLDHSISTVPLRPRTPDMDYIHLR